MVTTVDLSAVSPPFQLPGVGFWPRSLARLIDLAVHYLIGLAAGIVVGVIAAVIAAATDADPQSLLQKLDGYSVLGVLAALLGSASMHILSEGLHGSTFGKRICGITVVFENGSPAGLSRALKRTLLFYVDSLFFGLVAAGTMSESVKRQRLGDRWASTMVVRIAQLDSSQRRSAGRFLAATSAGMVVDGVLMTGGFVVQLLK